VTINIVVADDHHVVRVGLRSLLEADAEFSVVGEATNGLDVIPVLEDLQPDVVIVDLLMPGQDGFQVTQQVTQRWPEMRVIILTIQESEVCVQKAFANGAAAYVLKNSTPADLARAIRDVVTGRRYLSPALFDRAIEAFVNCPRQTTFDPYTTLTRREQEVLTLAAMGLNIAQVATRLSISPRTVETHRSKILHKLELRTQTDLVRYAVRRGIIHLDD
jgi:two-component system, NarL family, response regulator NreC